MKGVESVKQEADGTGSVESVNEMCGIVERAYRYV